MWEVIESNRKKSIGLIVLMLLLFLAMGTAIGISVAPDWPWLGMASAVVLWLVMLAIQFTAGESILLRSAGAHKVEKPDAPQLYNIVEEMKIANGMTTMPDVYIIDSRIPNAFAVGRKPERAAVAVTSGLLARLNRDEVQGVIGHELAHIQNRDTQFMTLAGVTLGALIMIADFYLHHMRYTAPRTRDRDENRGAALMMVVALLLAVLTPLLARLLYFACSRKREYLADACSARATRYPEGLARALEKIAGDQNKVELPVNRTLAAMYIVNPLAAHGGGWSWFSTHPPTKNRIGVLAGMAGEFSLKAYDTVFRHQHRDRGIIGARSLNEEVQHTVPQFEHGEDREVSPQKSWREAKEILHRINGFSVLSCLCGARLKLPPDFEDEVTCPHCRRPHTTAGVMDDLSGAKELEPQ